MKVEDHISKTQSVSFDQASEKRFLLGHDVSSNRYLADPVSQRPFGNTGTWVAQLVVR